MRRTVCIAVMVVWVTAAAGLADRRRAVVSPPTFNREVVRVLQANCQSCHRADGMAPFPLITYSDAASRAHQIVLMTGRRRMPPWKPSAGCGAFQQERRLTDAQVRMIEAWVAAGVPEGDRRDLPPPAVFAEDWKLGPPDILMAMPQMYAPPSGRDIFRCFVLPSTFPQETLVAAIDFRPRARSAVHHILAYVDDSGKAEQLDTADPEPGYECMGGPRFAPTALLGGWFPGSEPAVMPTGVAARVAPEARIVLQMHYHLHHPGQADRTELALYLVSHASRTLQFLAAENQSFVIPAGASSHQLSAAVTLPADINVHAIGAHMHLLGRTIDVQARLPDGTSRCLLRIEDWDPMWQGMYAYQEPVRLPAGTRIEASATYDNSSANPRNPHQPPRDVAWGEEALNEMLSAYLAYTLSDPVGVTNSAP